MTTNQVTNGYAKVGDLQDLKEKVTAFVKSERDRLTREQTLLKGFDLSGLKRATASPLEAVQKLASYELDNLLAGR